MITPPWSAADEELAAIAATPTARVAGWAALAGAVVAGFMALVAAAGWSVFALLNGVVSLLALLLVPLRDQGLEAGP